MRSFIINAVLKSNELNHSPFSLYFYHSFSSFDPSRPQSNSQRLVVILDGWSHQRDSLWWRGALDMMDVQDTQKTQTELGIHISVRNSSFTFCLPSSWSSLWFTFPPIKPHIFSLFSFWFAACIRISSILLPTSRFRVVRSQGSAATLDGLSHQAACCDSSLEMRWRRGIRTRHRPNEM